MALDERNVEGKNSKIESVQDLESHEVLLQLAEKRLARSFEWSRQLGVKIVAMDFRTGSALVFFAPEAGPLLAAMEGVK